MQGDPCSDSDMEVQFIRKLIVSLLASFLHESSPELTKVATLSSIYYRILEEIIGIVSHIFLPVSWAIDT